MAAPRGMVGTIWIGVDPGVSGGIACIFSDGEVRATKMPETDRELFLLLDQWGSLIRHDRVNVRAVLEHVWARPGFAGAFRFGQSFGACGMALAAADIPYELVTPQRWQKALSCQTKGDKNVTKERAAKMFPRLTVGHAIADALLIAEFCRRQDRGRHGEEERRKGWKRLEADRAARSRRKAAKEGAAVATAPRHGGGAKR